jgi:hypothetical protein
MPTPAAEVSSARVHASADYAAGLAAFAAKRPPVFGKD